jgi:cytoplasmic iron level regulating protein YaaA (DUF328/UPF0246 family)
MVLSRKEIEEQVKDGKTRKNSIDILSLHLGDSVDLLKVKTDIIKKCHLSEEEKQKKIDFEAMKLYYGVLYGTLSFENLDERQKVLFRIYQSSEVV